MQVRLRFVESHSLSCEPHRGREQLRPGDAAAPAMRLPQPEPRPRHGDSGRAGAEELPRVAVEVDPDLEQLGLGLRVLRHLDVEIEEPSSRLSRLVDQQEAAASEAGQRALADPRDPGRGDAGIDGVAALT